MKFHEKLDNFESMCNRKGFLVSYHFRSETIYVSRFDDGVTCMYSKGYFMVNYNDVLFKDMILTFKILDDGGATIL